jgi:predicted transcriptional regulator
MTGSSFYFDPNGSGLTVFLGPTEARLMELAFKHDYLTVKSALFLLGPDHRLAYTTVMTTLSRLASKGILARKKVGRVYEYRPVLSRAQFIQERVELVKACLKRSFS